MHPPAGDDRICKAAGRRTRIRIPGGSA
jgi:hypothetical protein